MARTWHGQQREASPTNAVVLTPGNRAKLVLRNHPNTLVFVARRHVDECLAGARDGYRVVRMELGGTLPPHTIEAVLAAYREEGHRHQAVAHGVDLIGRALPGEVFKPAR